MAELFKWDPTTLSVKVAAMDGEHQILIQKMNKLCEAHNQKLTKAIIRPLLVDFVDYTNKHFQNEERYMESITYSGLSVHKGIHQQLLAQVKVHVDEFERSGILTDAFFRFLSIWLTSHIRGIDSKYSMTSK